MTLAYKRGIETTDRELLKLQLWAEYVDEDLYGKEGGTELGVIREHRDRVTTDRVTDKYVRNGIIFMGACGGIPGIALLLALLHVIKLP